jgi:hypothetical protein
MEVAELVHSGDCSIEGIRWEADNLEDLVPGAFEVHSCLWVVVLEAGSFAKRR